LGTARASVFCVLYPYIEQKQLWDLIVETAQPAEWNGNDGDAWWKLNDSWWSSCLTAAQQEGISNVPIYMCPSRRASVTVESSDYIKGAKGDYAAVIRYVYNNDETLNPDRWVEFFSPTGHRIDRHFGALRVCSRSGSIQSWKPRDSMSRFTDGTSNTIVFGEKHIPSANIGVCGPTSDKTWDCSYLIATGSYNNSSRNFQVGRSIHLIRPEPIAKGANDFADYNLYPHPAKYNYYAFGSAHSGVCNFTMGDGSVRGIPTSVSRDVMMALAHVSDGKTVTLP
ncbi:MAG: DUF1559 domain-containing protein, partial [Planctomycetia bacterium]|nr:DUF1559 domain-containing protein [Planctomycetia bacterium]